MKTAYKVAIGAVVVVTFLIIFAIGYVGLVKIPFITPSPQTYANGTDLTDSAHTLYSILQQVSGDEQMSTLEEIRGTGLDIHIYGTDDSMASVVSHFDSQMLTWELMQDESGTGWTTKIWRHVAYGFALMAGEHALLKARTGYNTIYMTVDGPIQSWMEIMDEFD